MIDFDKFKYRVGDKIKRLVYHPDEVQPAEYEIIAIEEATGFGSSYRRTRNSGGTTGYRHYRLKNLSNGCLDQPIWVSQHLVHTQYEPCNPAIKLLYKRNEPTFEVRAGGYADMLVMDPKHLAIFKKVFDDGKLMVASTPRQSGKSWLYQQFLQHEANRAGEQSDPHSLDALRYAVLGQPSKKVSR
jgi:hypothetical protein